MDRIIEILRAIRPGVDWENMTGIIDDGLLDSFDMISLIGELEDAFKVRVGLEYLEPMNFNSVSAIMALLEELGAVL
jgi:acyl carrier protein